MSRPQVLKAEIQPIPPGLLHRQVHSSSSSWSNVNEVACATKKLWKRLVDASKIGYDSRESDSTPGHLSVAISWPEDRRLGKGKQRNLMIWVEPLLESTSNDSETCCLHVPQQLLPAYSAPPLRVELSVLEPIALSLVILQRVLPGHTSAQEDLEDDMEIDTPSLSDLGVLETVPNGKRPVNGHKEPSRPPKILRQSELLTTHTSSEQYRVLLCEPVLQGICTTETRLILSNIPYRPPQEDLVNGDGTLSEHSFHTRLSAALEEFDPDAFLSADLTLSGILQNGEYTPGVDDPVDGYADIDGDENGENLTGSWSSNSNSNSGSITPRPGMLNGMNGNGHLRNTSPPRPVDDILEDNDLQDGHLGVRFTAVRACGPGPGTDTMEEIAWVGVGGLGRAGIFEGDWVILRTQATDTRTNGRSNGSSSAIAHASSGESRLVKILAYEALDEEDSDLPNNPILLSPSLYRVLYPHSTATRPDLYLSPTSFGARTPSLPIARTMTIARIATTEGVDKRYERSWIKGLKEYFSRTPAGKGKRKAVQSVDDEGRSRLVKRGDVISVPIYQDTPLPEVGDKQEDTSDNEESDSESDENSDDDDGNNNATLPAVWSNKRKMKKPTAVGYFIVTSLSFDPLVPLEEDFRSTASSKARAGELGCWINVADGNTRMVLTGVERAKINNRHGDSIWHRIKPAPPPYSPSATRLRNLLNTTLVRPGSSPGIQLSVLVKGPRGSGKRSLIRSLSDELGFNIVAVQCYDIIGDTPAITEGSIRAALDKVKSAAPSILLLVNIDALAIKSDAPNARPPPIVKVLKDAVISLKTASVDTGFPCVLLATTVDVDTVDLGVAAIFKQGIEINAPNEAERLVIARHVFQESILSPEVDLKSLATQSAALQAIDIVALASRAKDGSLERAISSTKRSIWEIQSAGLAIGKTDLEKAVSHARGAYSDSIGAPKIPNVRWEDIGGLADVKKEILETVQLPLDHPELFAAGLKKRSGILLYGPPGTGKTLLAKAVATSCSLNFFSVKGPELLNMYIGESEANVRRIFQRARDASPCIIFMDELDSVAPKRGNQGDSGGVMDRIVSQLLAELDGMSGGSAGSDIPPPQVFIMGATNRPDLLDPALLRPGRFDRLVYLSVPKTHTAQADILKALTRKFNLHPSVSMETIAEMVPMNCTGADLYALASDAMLRAMTRTAGAVDARIAELEAKPKDEKTWPSPLTPQYYLGRMAKSEEYEVVVEEQDFEDAVSGIVPSVSESEMRHYERVQEEFRGVEGQNGGE